MSINFEVKRRRLSATQGEVEIFANGKFIIRYGDNIIMGGGYGENIGGWASSISDEHFIKRTIMHYTDRVIKACFN